MPGKRMILVMIGEMIIFCSGADIIKLREDHEIGLDDVKEHSHAAETLTKGSAFVAILDGGLPWIFPIKPWPAVQVCK